MTKVVLCPPQGDFIVAPDEAVIRLTILNPDPEFWEEGSRDAGLHRDNDNGEMNDALICDYVRPDVFCVTYEPAADEPPRVLLGDGSPDEKERVRLTQNVFTVPQSYLVSASRALEAALSFLKDGVPLPCAQWETFDAEL